MDFAWVVDALRRGIKVTREAWKQDPPVKYLYMLKDAVGNRAIMMCPNNEVRGSDLVWYPNADQLLYVDDWEEYVEPRKSPAHISELPFVMTEQDSHGGKPVAAVSDEEHQKELLDTLVNAFAELVSQRVTQLLQDKKDTDPV